MSRSLRRDRGASTSIQLALSLTTILGAGALVVDIGFARLVHCQLQGAVDAAAHGGVGYLDGTTEGMDLARQGAVDLAALNLVNGEGLALDPSEDVELGFWDGEAFIESNDPDQVDAVRVTGNASNLKTWLARVAFGTESLATNAQAIAVLPPVEHAGAIDCYLPLAVPECLFDKHPDDTIIDVDLELQNDSNDNAGWALLGSNPASASNIRDHINNCQQDGEIEILDTTQLNNGTLTSALSELADAIIDSETTYDEETFGPMDAPYDKSDVDKAGAYGNTLEGPLIVFDGGEDCDNVKFNQDSEVSGFVWGAVYDVQSKGAARDKNIAVRLDTVHEFDVATAGGGDLDTGVVYQPPIMLVR